MILVNYLIWEVLFKYTVLFTAYIVGTWNSSFGQFNNDWKQALLGMQEKQIDLRPLITLRFTLDKYQEAFHLMHERREMYCKVMFVM